MNLFALTSLLVAPGLATHKGLMYTMYVNMYV